MWPSQSNKDVRHGKAPGWHREGGCDENELAMMSALTELLDNGKSASKQTNENSVLDVHCTSRLVPRLDSLIELAQLYEMGVPNH